MEVELFLPEMLGFVHVPLVSPFFPRSDAFRLFGLLVLDN